MDSRVRGLFFEPGNGSPIGIVSHGCHPVVLGRNDSFSADYPGRFLEELNAYGVRAVFLNEPCGDLDPLSNACQWGGGSERTLEIYGRDLAEATFRGLKKGETCSFSEIETVSRDCKLEGVVPDKAEREAAKKTASEELERDASNGLARVELEWISMLEERVNRGGLSKEMRLEVQAFRVDDTLVVGLAGEVFSSLAKEVRDAFPGRFMLLAGTCNGLLGYVPSRSDVVSGGYASRVAPKIYGMLCPTPAAGEALMDQVVETIQGLQFEPKA